MEDLVLGFVAGLLVGWNVLAQPAWVAGWIGKLKAMIKKPE